MGKRLNELKKGVSIAARKCAISYEEYHEDTDEMDKLRTGFAALKDKHNKSSDAKAREKMKKELIGMQKSYAKVKGHRDKVKTEFRKFLNNFDKWYTAFSNHIRDRQINSKWRSKEHTKEAIQLGIQYGNLKDKYTALHDSFYR